MIVGQKRTHRVSEVDQGKTRWSRIQRLARSSEADWAWFVERYQSVIRKVFRLYAQEAYEPSLVDEFWGKFFDSESLQKIPSGVPFRAFLAAIVRNYARQARRVWYQQSKRYISVDDGAEADLVRHEAPEVEAREHSLWAHQMLELALRCVEKRSAPSRTLLVDFYGLDRPRVRATAIANRLGLSAGAVHVRLNRARQLLLDCLKREVRETVTSEDELADELRLILEGLRKSKPGLFDDVP